MILRQFARPESLFSWLCIALVVVLVMVMISSTRPAAAAEPPLKIVAFGDSLTAGFNLKPSESFAAQLQTALQAKGHSIEVINAGVSGDTTAGGLERLEWTLQSGADAVILELGANDALRGLDPKQARTNLDRMLDMIKAKNADVLLAGMKAPGNWGADYVTEFDSIYPDLAAKHGALLYPFFLEGVALDPAYVMQDGLHPTATGVAEIVKRILPDVETLIARVQKRKAAAH